MTQRDALVAAIAQFPNDGSFTEVIDTLNNMIAHIDNRALTPEQKEARNAANREKTAANRAAHVAAIAPILRKVIDTTDKTAAQIYNDCQNDLPVDMSINKVQSILLREMAPELVKTETKGKANTYRLKERA